MQNKRKILLTGGAGFIGRNILENLGNRYEFLAPIKEELDLRKEEDVLKYFEKNSVEVVIHTAAIGFSEKERSLSNVFADNLRMFSNLVRRKRFYKKIIFFGSGAEYDKRRNIVKVKETDFDQSIPTDEYSIYKYICSKYIEKSEKNICLRLFGIYGKYENYRFKFISNAILKNLLKQDIVIYQNVLFDYLFADDLMPIVDYFILNKPKFKSYNVVPDQSIDSITIAKIINEISDYKSKITVLKDGLNKEYTGDNSRLKNEIPKLKFTDYKEGIRKLFNYYKENIENLDKDAIVQDNYLKYCQQDNKIYGKY